MVDNLFIDFEKKSVRFRVPYFSLGGKEDDLWEAAGKIKGEGFVFIFEKNKLNVFIDFPFDNIIPKSFWLEKHAYLDKEASKQKN
jgi:hypothetical protein